MNQFRKLHSGVISTTKEEKSVEIWRDFSSQARRNDTKFRLSFSHYTQKRSWVGTRNDNEIKGLLHGKLYLSDQKIITMQRAILKRSIVLLILVFLFFTSCQKEEQEKEPRTLEQEMVELNAMIQNLITQDIDVDTTDMGVFYIVQEPGEGEFPQEGDTCHVEYSAYLPTGSRFYTTEDYYNQGIRVFPYKNPQDMIAGLEDGIGHLNKGAEADMIIPSPLAYGAQGTNDVPPFTSVIFVVKMHDLVPALD